VFSGEVLTTFEDLGGVDLVGKIESRLVVQNGLQDFGRASTLLGLLEQVSHDGHANSNGRWHTLCPQDRLCNMHTVAGVFVGVLVDKTVGGCQVSMALLSSCKLVWQFG